MVFADRQEAGQRLARRLMHLKDLHPVVLALPRGGVPVGCEVARVLAAPVAFPDALARMQGEADEVVCLDTPAGFMAVGQFYRRFPQLEGAEVTALTDAARNLGPPDRTAPGTQD
jgi:predicted phosphoribosyltransferase